MLGLHEKSIKKLQDNSYYLARKIFEMENKGFSFGDLSTKELAKFLWEDILGHYDDGLSIEMVETSLKKMRLRKYPTMCDSDFVNSKTVLTEELTIKNIPYEN